MKRLLLTIITTLLLFTTSASADHTMYLPSNSYRDSGLPACPTIEASLKVINSIMNNKYLTYGGARKISEFNNCEFHRDPVTFFVNELLCNSTRSTDGKTFTIAKVIIENNIEEQFTILYTKSDTVDCDGYLTN